MRKVFFVFILFVFFISCHQPTAHESEVVYDWFEFGDFHSDFYWLYSADYIIEEEAFSELGENFYHFSAFTKGTHLLKAEWIIIEVGQNMWKGYTYYFNFYL